ncbi:MAG: alcohol dehydrogenase catalytic domain-containing protein [Planctomycetaceae bacterium]
MRAMILPRIVSLDQTETPLESVELPTPQPQPGEVLVRTSVCGVCHTELDEIEGRTPPPELPVVPGHEIVGRVESLGPGVTRWNIGDRVGIGWIHSSSGADDENLSPEFRATGRDVNGGYAEFVTVPQEYAFPIPACFSDRQAAPLLRAGAIGYRALRLTNLTDGEPLGLTGFGASAHLVLQLARYLYPHSPISVFARAERARDFAQELGAVWAGGTTEQPPEPLQAVIDTTPAWTPVVEALANLRPGGRLVINAIRKEDCDKECLLNLRYRDHLWMEREIKSVANIAGRDVAEFLPLAEAAGLSPVVETHPLEEANHALIELRRGRNRGAKVLLVE